MESYQQNTDTASVNTSTEGGMESYQQNTDTASVLEPYLVTAPLAASHVSPG